VHICLFGAWDPHYPRSSIIKAGLEACGVEVSTCWVPPGYKFWLRYPRLLARSWSACRRADVLFVPEFRQKDIPLAALAARLYGLRLIHDPLASRYETKIMDWRRKPPSSWQARWNRAIDRLSFRLSDLILADTASHADYFHAEFGLSPSKTAVLPVGFDDRMFSPQAVPSTRPEPGLFTVLFIGSYLPLHGVDTIVRAAGLVAGRDKAVRFRLVGKGQTFDLAVRLAAELGLDNISFEGWAALEDFPLMISRADICLGIFGRTEKTARVVPHKIFQAMGSARPVITARTPAAEEFFTHGRNIILCNPPLAETLAEAVLRLKSDSQMCHRIASNGLELVREKYSTAALGRALLNILAAHFRFKARRRT
jgi:glycosyltransferase involved in cell wall biosynthesis